MKKEKTEQDYLQSIYLLRQKHQQLLKQVQDLQVDLPDTQLSSLNNMLLANNAAHFQKTFPEGLAREIKSHFILKVSIQCLLKALSLRGFSPLIVFRGLDRQASKKIMKADLLDFLKNNLMLFPAAIDLFKAYLQDPVTLLSWEQLFEANGSYTGKSQRNLSAQAFNKAVLKLKADRVKLQNVFGEDQQVDYQNFCNFCQEYGGLSPLQTVALWSRISVGKQSVPKSQILRDLSRALK